MYSKYYNAIQMSIELIIIVLLNLLYSIFMSSPVISRRRHFVSLSSMRPSVRPSVRPFVRDLMLKVGEHDNTNRLW